MKKILLVCSFASLIFANEYYAKLEPIESYSVASAVSGEVIYTNESLEGAFANNSVIVEIDAKVDKVELEETKNKIKLYDKMIKIEQNNYERLKKVTTRSDFDKDSQLLKSISLQSTKADLLIKVAQLEDSISNKKLVENNKYIYEIAVKKGNWVNSGTLLYEAKDMSQGKLEIFVPISQANTLEDKKIYLDDKQTDLKINKIFGVADSKNISSYKVEILIPNPKNFSKLVKVEFK